MSNRALLLALIVLAAAAILLTRPWQSRAADPALEEALAADEPTSPPERAPQAPAAPDPAVAGAPALDANRREEMAAAETGRLILEILRADGTPAASARYALERDGELLASGETGAEARIDLQAPGGTGALLLAEDGRALARTALPLDAGEHRIVLEPGGLLSGAVFFEDGSPGADLELRVRSEAPLVRPEPAKELCEALGLDEDAASLTVLQTDRQGGFALSGLPPDWSGKIWVPRGLAVVGLPGESEPSPHLELLAPQADLLIRLTRRASIRARVVDPDDGRPVAGANAQLRGQQGRQRWSATIDRDQAGEDGRVEFFPDLGRLTRLRVLVQGPEGGGYRYHELPDMEFEASRDLGDLPLAPTRRLRFEVRDLQGDPVAGAVASVAQIESEPTGADGQGLIEPVPRDEFALRATAEGFAPRSTDVPAGIEGPVTLTLGPANRLEVQLVGPEESERQAILISLGGEPPTLSESARFGATPFEDHLEAGSLRSSRLGDLEEWRVQPDAQGRVVFRALASGVSLQVRALSLAGTVLAEQTLSALGETEDRTVRLEVERAARTLAGRVRDTAGAPVPDARVQIEAGDGTQAQFATTDDQGRFESQAIFVDRVDLRIRRNGYATLDISGFALPEDGAVPEFTLESGHSVRVEVVDEAGRPVVTEWVRARAGSGPQRRAAREDEHVFLLRDLPDEPLNVEARVGGREYSQDHDPRVESMRFLVPVHGALEVEVLLSGELDPDIVYYLGVVPAGFLQIQNAVYQAFRFHEQDRYSWRAPALLPGDYQLGLARYDPDADGAIQGYLPVLPLRTITVEPQETTQVVLTAEEPRPDGD